MKVLKQFRFVFSLLAIFTLLLTISSCRKPCRVPNPLIEFGVAKDTFAVTPGGISNAQTVQITAFDAAGAAQDSFTVAPGQQQKLHFDTSVQRPIQLKFLYQSATGVSLAEDSIRIDDRVKKGVTLPDMDIIMNKMVPGGQTCPTSSTTVTPTITDAPNNTKKATFPWTTNERFEVTLASTGSPVISKKFRLNPMPALTDGDTSKLMVYNSSSFTCLTLNDADAEPESRYAMIITAISDFCSIRGRDTIGGRNISVTYPNNYTITVKK